VARASSSTPVYGGNDGQAERRVQEIIAANLGGSAPRAAARRDAPHASPQADAPRSTALANAPRHAASALH